MLSTGLHFASESTLLIRDPLRGAELWRALRATMAT